MNCQDTEKLLHAYVDGELDLMKSVEMEDHLRECTGCAQAQQSLHALRAAIRSQASYFEPTAKLQARIHSVIRANNGVGLIARSSSRTWLAVAASFVLLAIGAWSLTRVLPVGSPTTVLAEELLASHVRSQILASHLVDVESSDQHTVKPWFEGKLDFSPEVPDLYDQGFTLVGGRLDYLERRPVAALVYKRRQHLINLFTWPSDSESAPASSAMTRQGFHLFSWSQSGMAYWVVSDLNEGELREFVDLIRNKLRHS